MPRTGQGSTRRSGEGAVGESLNGAPSQRERLVDSMIELAARDGYQAVSIAQLSARAGVSSSTFYEVFNDKEDCARAAYRAASERILAMMSPVDPRAASTSAEWEQQGWAALRRLMAAVCENRAAAQLLFVEALAGGSAVRAERAEVLRTFQRRAASFLSSTSEIPARIDLPPIALVGGIRTVVSRHLRVSREEQLPELAGDILAWVNGYAVPGTRPAWSTGPAARLRGPIRRLPRAADVPQRLPRGRHRLPPSVVARSHRTRILHATAQATMNRGYAETTVADIVAAAGVSRRVFYEHFTDKEHAFLEAQQYPTQHILDECATAFFAASEWPERIWNGLKALLGLVVVNPALSHLRLVECYVAGPDAVRRAEDVTRSFTIFMEEGFHVSPAAARLPRLASHAVAGAVFEIIQRHAANGDLDVLPTLLPQLTYIVIAPFVEPGPAVELLRQLIAREEQISGESAFSAT